MSPAVTSDQGAALCPSAKCSEDAVLLGLVQADGSVSFLQEKLRVDRFFVELAHQGRTPEKRFRFADTCMKCGCQQWTGSRCGVIDRVLADNPDFVSHEEPSQCSIRAECRWHRQHGLAACAICPLVITDMTPQASAV